MLIRNYDNFQGLSGQFLRISFKTHEINRSLADKLRTLTNDAGLDSTAGWIAC